MDKPEPADGVQNTPRDARMEMAHVLFMDIVGYSRSPIDEQKALLTELQEVVRGTDEFRAASVDSGLISLPTGDGIALVFFGSPEDPVQCAVQVSRALRRKSELKLRLGVHTGPVYRVADINANRNVAGGGINIAQRVMDCGDAGHILVSDSVASALGQLKTWSDRLHDLGEVEVKHGVRVHVYNLFAEDFGNPERPSKIGGAGLVRKSPGTHRLRWAALAVLALLLLIAAAVRTAKSWSGTSWWTRGLSASSPSSLVAVRPFRNLSPDRSQDFFATGITEEIRGQLSKVAALRVLSRAAVEQYNDADLAKMARDHGVTSIVEGSVRRDGARVRVAVELIDTRNQQTLWSDQYNGELSDVFGVQSEVAVRIVGALRANLSPEERARVERRPTANLDAYDLYLRANQLLPFADHEKNGQAIELLQRALTLDPAFAAAKARLSYRTFWLALFGVSRKLDEAMAMAREALQLDPTSSYAHMVLGAAYGVKGNMAEARLSFLRALELDPNDFDSMKNLAVFEANTGRIEEGLYWARRAFALSGKTGNDFYHLTLPLLMLRDDDLTWRVLKEAERRFPAEPRVQWFLAVLDYYHGRGAEALLRIRAALTKAPDNLELQVLRSELTWLTGAPDAQELNEELVRTGSANTMGLLLNEGARVRVAFLLMKQGRSSESGVLLRQGQDAALKFLETGTTAFANTDLAAVRVLGGDRRGAIDSLQRAYDSGLRDYAVTEGDPIFEPLHSDPAFQALMARMKNDLAAQRKHAADRGLLDMGPLLGPLR